MGRLEEKFRDAAVSRFDLVVDSSNKKPTKTEKDELSLREWYGSCQSEPGSSSHDFFCREWPEFTVSSSIGLSQPSITGKASDQHSDDERRGDDAEAEHDEESPQNGSRRSSQKSSSSSGEGDESSLLLPPTRMGATEYVPPLYVSQHVREQQDARVCFFPATTIAESGPSAPALWSQHRQQQQEEEGLYTGSRPHVTAANMNKMINRLDRQDNKVWLSDGGTELLQESPVEGIRYRRPQHRAPEEEVTQLVRFVQATSSIADEATSDVAGAASGSWFLQLQLLRLQLQQHQLQSAEHQLSQRLMTAAMRHSHRVSTRQTELLWNKLRVLRSSMARLLQLHPELVNDGLQDNSSSISKPRRNIRAEVDYKRRSELYRSSIRSTRQELHASGHLDRCLLTEALTCWAQLKELRQQQGYSSTALTLSIRKYEVENVEAERQLWQDDIEAEVDERLEEQRLQYRADLEKYEDDKKQWRTQRKARRAAKQRDEEWLAGGCRGDEARVLQATADQLTLDIPAPPAPAPPAPLADTNQLTMSVSTLLEQSHRPPGEPVIQLQVSSTGPVTGTRHCPQHELRRRQHVGKTRFAIKVIINKKAVTQSAWCSLDDAKWSTELSFPVYASLTTLPRTATLQLLQTTATVVASALPRATTSLVIATTSVPLHCTTATATANVRRADAANAGGGCGENTDGGARDGEDTAGWIGEEVKAEFVSSKHVVRSAAGSDDAPSASAADRPQTKATLTLRYLLTNTGQQQQQQQQRSQTGSVGSGSVNNTGAEHGDPNDPTNARSVAARMQKILKRRHVHDDTKLDDHEDSVGDEDDDDVFECDGESVGWSWLCSRQQLDSDLRLRMLRLRDARVPEFQGLTRVPALSSQILRSAVWDYEAKQASSSTLQDDSATDHDAVYGLTAATGTGDSGVCETADWLEEVVERLAAAERLICSVRRRLLQQTARAAAVLQPSDMVQEEQIPDIGTLGTSLVSVLRPKRPLKPDRKVRGAVRGAGLTGKQVNLIVNVARAFNVPVRSPGQEWGPAADGESGVVRAFVTVQFQGKQKRTSVAQGPNPTWNQQLVLPFRAPNDDYSSISLGLVRENIVLQLYDERLLQLDNSSSTDTAAGDAALHNTLHTRLHNTWLASLTIPTSALLHTSKIEGTFEVVSPVSVLGYTRASDAAVGSSPLARTTTSLSTHLTLYITLEPTLPQPQPIKGLQPCHEPPSAVSAASSWQVALSRSYPQRHYQPHVTSISGHLVLIHRMLAPVEPPVQLVHEGEWTETQCRVSWFVSLIPTLPDMSLFPGTPNITANSEQFVNMLCGGEAERAVLLTNYFLYLGYTAFLLIGSSVCHGQYWCVLVKAGPPETRRPSTDDNNPAAGGRSDSNVRNGGGAAGRSSEWRVWCPGVARSYSTRDAFCPVKAVYMLVSQHNVWGNCQRWEDPARVEFNVSDSSCWRSLYGNRGQHPPLPSLQPPSIPYPPPSPAPDRDKLTIIVRDAFMKWRPHHRTVWNRDACEVLRHALRKLDALRATGAPPPPPSTHLTRLHHSHLVCGVCIHQGWRGIGPVLAAVHNSDVHACTAEGVEFSIALHMLPYPAKVMSVWIYVASLVRRTD